MRHAVSRRVRGQQGMTLLEVLVTLGVMTIFMAGTLQFYSTNYRILSAGDAMLDLTHDAHTIMSRLAEDIRRTELFLPDFSSKSGRTVVAAMRMAPRTAADLNGVVVVYSLSDGKPAHLFRTVMKGSQERSLELAPSVTSLQLYTDATQLIRVELALEKTVSGQKKTFEVSSAYAMRF
ncbi:hypothetical protein CSB45_02710 [candidate division KSB3 bacterium]|uniref:Prepilin-type N-terminal cleavage/methylation domain-containing protein n=1 Tax=candidate division KSB3 bacterium TaxID=2044937 RepID=A0A2G6EA14_9BACT|nr:MAG: hypothetical protein CSB45_02710 [candidate division KSB3 bacterium]PIE30990.1 MAG: hypothetical protein CSA57_01325 [candidate division KSB3 bacterium]